MSNLNENELSKIIVNAAFTVGANVLLKLEPASTLDVENTLTIEDLVWVNLLHGSTFTINPTSGGAASITSSTTGITTVRYYLAQ